MRNLILCLTLALAVAALSACGPAGPANPADIALPENIFDLRWEDRSPFRSGLIASEQGVLEELPGASLYRLNLTLGENRTHLVGEEQIRYTNQEDVPLNEIYLRLFPSISGGSTSILQAQIDGEDVFPGYELEDSALRLPLAEPLQPGQKIVIRLVFAVEVPEGEGGNYAAFSYSDGVLALAHFYPMIPVYNDEGWNLEVPPPYGDVTFNDSSFYLVRVTAPSSLTLVASGVEVDRTREVGEQRVTFAAGPMRDFYLVASEAYEFVSQQVGATAIHSYYTPGLVDGGRRALRYAAEALDLFNREFGTYPFTEFDLVGTATTAGGIEYPGITAIASRLYDPENPDSASGYFEGVVAHETGHQWFYSLVGNDQVDEPWLDESLTQYLTLLYFQDAYGEPGWSGFAGSLYGRWDRVSRAQIPVGMPVASYTEAEYGAIVYGRGAIFFMGLAEAMGDSAFRAFLRDYYQTYRWGIATTADLEATAEAHCACDLTPLFEQWIYPE
jgi:hypothetical protein